MVIRRNENIHQHVKGKAPILDPRNTYIDNAVWREKAEDLAIRFINNFEQYTDTDAGEALIKAGPIIN